MFTDRATTESVVPILVWSYSVAIGPLVWMGEKDIRGGSGEASTATVFSAQIGYIVMILMILFATVSRIDVVTVFATIMLVGLILHFLVVALIGIPFNLTPPSIYFT